MAACWPKSRHTLLAVLGVVLLGLLGWRRGAGAGPRGAEPAGPVELRTVPDFGFTRDAIVAEAKATAALAWRKRALPNYVTLATTIWDRHPANVLVFGLGFDNALYYKANPGGVCVFVDDSVGWNERVRVALNVTVLHYEYTTRRDDRLYHHHRNMKDTSKPDLYNQYYMHNLPPNILTTPWDVVIIDGPAGFHKDTPGRAAPIYTVWYMLTQQGRGPPSRTVDVFVHDVGRLLESEHCKRLFGEYERINMDNMWHFKVPAH